MAGSSVLAVLAMAELIPSLDTVLELLRSPLGAVLFVPLYALWVTLLLPGVWASMLAGVPMAPGAAVPWFFRGLLGCGGHVFAGPPLVAGLGQPAGPLAAAAGD